MSAPDPVPAELAARIVRARNALKTAIPHDPSTSHATHWRALAAAKRELADAYRSAYEALPYPAQTLNYAVLDASYALMAEAREFESWARGSERNDRMRASLGGQA